MNKNCCFKIAAAGTIRSQAIKLTSLVEFGRDHRLPSALLAARLNLQGGKYEAICYIGGLCGRCATCVLCSIACTRVAD